MTASRSSQCEEDVSLLEHAQKSERLITDHVQVMEVLHTLHRSQQEVLPPLTDGTQDDNPEPEHQNTEAVFGAGGTHAKAVSYASILPSIC